MMMTTTLYLFWHGTVSRLRVALLYGITKYAGGVVLNVCVICNGSSCA